MNFKHKIILAPMVGISNIAFRKLCTDYGADIVYSQMIDTTAYIRGNRKLADFTDENNVVVQFFGNDPKIVCECAKEVQDKVQAIDLNLGCPHSNVVDRKCGSYLMKYPAKIQKIVKALINATNKPVTVKMRAGFDKQHINAVKIAKLCEKEGVAAVAVHGRASTVNYEHPVDYEIIKKVKEAVTIPVIGNGDILSGKDAKTMFDKTGCDSVMVGRGAIGNPAIFEEIKDFLNNKQIKKHNKKELFFEFLRYAKKYRIPIADIRTQAQWFTKGIKHGSYFREKMNTSKSIEEFIVVYDKIPNDSFL